MAEALFSSFFKWDIWSIIDVGSGFQRPGLGWTSLILSRGGGGAHARKVVRWSRRDVVPPPPSFFPAMVGRAHAHSAYYQPLWHLEVTKS